jgi:DNA modification methylase
MDSEILIGDCAETLKQFPDETFDCIVTDPPYGYSFMGLSWDKALPSLEALKECCRVLKSGAFGFFMCAPRQDVLSRMIIRLEDAGFNTGFSSIVWAYSSGFPKASAIDKLIDKRGTENEKYSELSKELCNYLRESRVALGLSQKDIAQYFPSRTGGLTGCVRNWENGANIPTIEQWRILKDVLKLNNPKFIELIERAISKRVEAEREIIGKKHYDSHVGAFLPNSDPERTQLYDTAHATDKAKEFDGSFSGLQLKPAVEIIITVMKPLECKSYVDQCLKNGKGVTWLGNCKIPIGQSDDIHAKNPHTHRENNRAYSDIYGEYGPSSYVVPDGRFPANLLVSNGCLSDLSRYLNLDGWFDKRLPELPEEQRKTFPFLIVPKPAKSEKNKYCENKHPTVKPLKLMSYLITLGSREGDLILDPFCGSGTTCEAARLLKRKFIGCELNEENKPTIEARAYGGLSREEHLQNEALIERYEEEKAVEAITKIPNQHTLFDFEI